MRFCLCSQFLGPCYSKCGLWAHSIGIQVEKHGGEDGVQERSRKFSVAGNSPREGRHGD